MTRANLAFLAFNGTYNFDMRTASHVDPTPLLAGIGITGCRYIPCALGKENSFRHLQPVFDELVAGNDVVMFCGTDNIEEIGFLFALNRPMGSRVFLVGTMFPVGHEEYDAGMAAEVLNTAIDVAGEGAWVVVGDSIVPGLTARKSRSEGAGSLTPAIAMSSNSAELVGYKPEFCISPSSLDKAVPIIFVALGDNGEWINWDCVDAVVVAGSGTGSIPRHLKSSIAARRSTQRVVVSTRCMEGPNHDDQLYPGSAASYEREGFEVSAFSGLNPMQARIRLILELSI